MASMSETTTSALGSHVHTALSKASEASPDHGNWLSPAFATAIVKVQGEIEEAKKGKKNPGFNSKYADLAACWEACRDALQAAGIAVLQWPCKADTGHVGMLTQLVFAPTGEVLSGFYQLPLKDPSNPQAVGSAITYARRYALCSVIGICPVDDDGNASAGVRNERPTVSKASEPSQVFTKAQLDKYRAEFAEASDKKLLYSTVKNLPIQEPEKTALLREFADIIKAEKAAGGAK